MQAFYVITVSFNVVSHFICAIAGDFCGIVSSVHGASHHIKPERIQSAIRGKTNNYQLTKNSILFCR